ncbi:Uma2 family endonuclease [Cyanothece sp. BG0011]|uniref:Uma2 family endonuclease n=1 Tax=Cyanothece sp. BG0011 TaxID=2082950 RepID=UPI000D1F0C2F|nr:Uma2 family endonuclease [Cyanothece sp. BG0011]
MKTSVNLTFKDYLEYDDNTNCLYELVEGELRLMTPAGPLHSDMIDFIFKQFDREIEGFSLDYVVKQILLM